MRLLSSELSEHIGKPVVLQGWLHKKRAMGALMFIVLRDRGGLVQAVVSDEKEQAKLQGPQVGSVLTIKGKAVSEPRAKGGVEIHEPEISVDVAVTDPPLIEIDKPIDHTPENLDTLFENRVINLRNIQETQLFGLRSDVTRYIREFLYQNDFTEITTPKLVAGAAEGGAEVFKLDYFGQEATLAQSPQLYKQIMVGVFERVFEIGPAFRAELSATTRHVSEVTMLDIEMGFIKDHGDVLDMVQDMVHSVLSRVYKEQEGNLKDLKAPDLVMKSVFPRYTMTEIHEMYSKATGKDTTKELDLTPDEERWICDYSKEHDGSELVFATHLPKKKMKFYHMANDDDTARSADLLFRGVEIATVPQREHRYEILVKQMKEAGVNPKDPGFSYYLQAFQYGLPPHGGCGFGIDRFVEKVVGLANIKEAILFPRDLNRLTP
jgi:nondiscriminating aspartyl-tRNA synthetase